MCGFMGVIGSPGAASLLGLGLQAMQHRGQDAAGIATRAGSLFHLAKGMGLVPAALPPERVAGMRGDAGIAHVRYPTAGTASTEEDAQPFLTRRPGIVLAHNGNLTNVPELSAALRATGWHVLSQCDAEPLLLVLADELTRRRAADHTTADLEAAVASVFQRVRGAYSAVALLEVDGQPTLAAFRDPCGIRPGVIGRGPDGAWGAASETVAFDVLGWEVHGPIPPGALVLLRAGAAPDVVQVAPPTPRPCAFERIYFARPDSVMEDGRINRLRWRLGRRLAREWAARGLAADLVVAVPDTSRPAAMAMAEALGLPNREGFIKNRYSGRTFIMPDDGARNAALRLKLNPIREMFEGRRVIVVDDSIVRGNTMRRLVRMLRGLRPAALHLAIFSPPVRHPCFYGIDMPSRRELVGARLDPDALAGELGVDSLTHLSLEGLRACLDGPICDACFSGDYPVEVTDEERAAIERTRRGAA